MRPLPVVQLDVFAVRAPGVTDRLVGFQIHLFVLDAAPHALDDYVVARRTPALHRQFEAAIQDRVGKGG
jgi:hypothetical protein